MTWPTLHIRGSAPRRSQFLHHPARRADVVADDPGGPLQAFGVQREPVPGRAGRSTGPRRRIVPARRRPSPGRRRRRSTGRGRRARRAPGPSGHRGSTPRAGSGRGWGTGRRARRTSAPRSREGPRARRGSTAGRCRSSSRRPPSGRRSRRRSARGARGSRRGCRGCAGCRDPPRCTGAPAAAAASSCSSPEPYPTGTASRREIFSPLYSDGLCEAVIMTPASNPYRAVAKYTAGVSHRPMSATPAPASRMPSVNAANSSSDDRRASRPTQISRASSTAGQGAADRARRARVPVPAPDAADVVGLEDAHAAPALLPVVPDLRELREGLLPREQRVGDQGEARCTRRSPMRVIHR